MKTNLDVNKPFKLKQEKFKPKEKFSWWDIEFNGAIIGYKFYNIVMSDDKFISYMYTKKRQKMLQDKSRVKGVLQLENLTEEEQTKLKIFYYSKLKKLRELKNTKHEKDSLEDLINQELNN